MTIEVKDIKNALQRDKYYLKKSIVNSMFICIVLVPMLFWNFLSGFVYNPIGGFFSLGIGLTILLMCLYPILKNYFLKKNRILYILLENEKFKINDLEKIFDKIMTIQKSIFWIKKLHPFDTFFGTDFGNTINIQVQFIFEQLMNLRSDLATRLTEQRQILESAKSEVEKNIVGTPELLAVSEAQKLRLDRQIEQFEELQRVLVRV